MGASDTGVAQTQSPRYSRTFHGVQDEAGFILEVLDHLEKPKTTPFQGVLGKGSGSKGLEVPRWQLRWALWKHQPKIFYFFLGPLSRGDFQMILHSLIVCFTPRNGCWSFERDLGEGWGF